MNGHTRSARRYVQVSLALCLLSPAAAGGATTGPAHLRSLHCGQVLTRSVRLAHDLVGCRGDGLVAGADGITVDLAGHRIVAAASRRTTGCGDVGRGCGVNITGFDDVTVEHGAIRGFPDGVDAIDARGVRVQRLVVRGASGEGVFFSEVSGALVRDNVIVHSGFRGIGIGDSTDVRVLRNHIRASNHTGVTLFRSDHSAVVRNVISGAGGKGGAPGDYGIEIGGSSADVIRRNTVRDNAFEGILVVAGRLGDIAWLRSVGNRIARNSVSSAGRATATGIELITVPDGVLEGTRVRANRVFKNGDVGILIDTEGGVLPRDTSLVRNLVTRNAPDGIRVEAPHTTLRKNRANRNRALGIFAVVGVRDGGGNVARGNGDDRQCVHVVCR